MGHDMLPLLLLLRLWGYAPRLLQYYPFYEDFGAPPQFSAPVLGQRPKNLNSKPTHSLSVGA